MKRFLAAVTLLAGSLAGTADAKKNIPISPTAVMALRAFLIDAIAKGGQVPASCHLTKGQAAYVCLTLNRRRDQITGEVVATRPGYCLYKITPWAYNANLGHAWPGEPTWLRACL